MVQVREETAETAAGALVLGLSIHGLAVCRALSKAGVKTYAIASEQHPANRTRYARVFLEPDVNSSSLGKVLTKIGPQIVDELQGQKCVLLPTNDTMVREIGRNWDSLSAWFTLSWSATISTVLDLQRKDRLIQIAAETAVPCPHSVIVESLSEAAIIASGPGYPCIVKPAQPLSSFKVSPVASEAEFLEKAQAWGRDFPLVAQAWIDGDDSSLFFYSAFWLGGKEIGGLTGRKRQSHPPAMGQGTIMESGDYPEVLELGREFVKSACVDGPVSVEFKRAADGEFYLIEPNVGRSEYCVDLLVQSGFNLPLIEYRHAAGGTAEAAVADLSKVRWYDTERDILGFVKDAFANRSLRPGGCRPVFPYFGHGDPRPLLTATAGVLRRIPAWAWRKLRGSTERLRTFGRRSRSNVRDPQQ